MNLNEIITVETVNNSAVLTGFNAHLDSPTCKITGKLIPTPSWVKDKDSFALFVENTPVPVRIFDMKRVLTINGEKVKQNKPTEIKTFAIKGSKGDYYTVTNGGNTWACTCVGFQFRKYCKHIDLAKDGK